MNRGGKMKYVYLIAYFFNEKDGSNGFGNVDLHCDGKISKIEDIRDFEKGFCEKKGFTKVITMHVSLLDEYHEGK